MGHNTSNRKLASAVRAELLTVYSNWSLAAGCTSCGRGSRVEVRVLVRDLPGRTVGRVVEPMRCQHCGRTPDVAWLGDAARRTVTLLGKGSY